MQLQPSTRLGTVRPPLPRRFGSLSTALLCAVALGFGASPAVVSAVVRLAGAPLSEELPAEAHTRSESQQRTGVRQHVASFFGRRTDGRGAASGPGPVNPRRLAHLSGFIPSPATELIRTGTQLLC